MANTINYVEIPGDPKVAKPFYAGVFGWSFKDWGPDYADTSAGVGFGINGTSDGRPRHPMPTVQVEDLEATREKVKRAGGKVTVDIFSFPGGRRFHFEDPAGNELAAWSEK
jgi:hypothetical protein